MFVPGKKVQIGLGLIGAVIIMLCYSSQLCAQNVLSVTDKKGRTYILSEHSRIKFKLRGDKRMYKGTVYNIQDSALNVNGNPIRMSDIEMLGFSAMRRGFTIATVSVLAGDGLAIIGGLAGGGAAITGAVYFLLVGMYATPILLGYTIYHSIHKRKFYLDELWDWEVYSVDLKKVKRKQRAAKEFDGSPGNRADDDYFSN